MNLISISTALANTIRWQVEEAALTKRMQCGLKVEYRGTFDKAKGGFQISNAGSGYYTAFFNLPAETNIVIVLKFNAKAVIVNDRCEEDSSEPMYIDFLMGIKPGRLVAFGYESALDAKIQIKNKTFKFASTPRYQAIFGNPTYNEETDVVEFTSQPLRLGQAFRSVELGAYLNLYQVNDLRLGGQRVDVPLSFRFTGTFNPSTIVGRDRTLQFWVDKQRVH